MGNIGYIYGCGLALIFVKSKFFQGSYLLDDWSSSKLVLDVHFGGEKILLRLVEMLRELACSLLQA